MRNPVGWFEIYVQDMARARAFYGAVLGVELEQMEGAPMEMWAFPAQPDLPGACGALVHMPGFPSGGNSTLIYFSCDDCGETAARAAASGGSIHTPRTDIGEHGFFALVLDTEGNMFGLHSMR